MAKGKTSEKLRRISHLKLLIPGLLVAALVLDGLLGYTMPDFSEGIDVAPQKVYAAEAPELEELAQTGEKLESKGPAGKLAKVDESGEYNDGEYIGSAKGFGGLITVKVTIKGGKIVSIKVLSASGETSSFFARAKAVIGVILNKQSTNVDAVSGATYSSNGIIKAVRNALAKAAKKKTDRRKSKDDDKKDVEVRKPVKPEKISSGDWKDGTYAGEGEGFGGKLHVEVTIENGIITKIKLIDSLDGKDYISKAKAGIFSSVMQKQGTDVDAVTGATFSSYGLIEAINDALSKAAYEAGDDTDQDTTDDTETGGTGSDEGSGTTEKSYKDGTYTRTAACIKDGWFDYDIDITLTVKDGRISSLSIYKGEDYTEEESDREENDGYLDMAVNGYGSRKGMISRILDSQSADVDTVTGATYSSEAIRSAVSGILSDIEIENKTDVDQKEDEKKGEVVSEDNDKIDITSEEVSRETEDQATESRESEEQTAEDDTQTPEAEEIKPADPPSDNSADEESAGSIEQKKDSLPPDEKAVPAEEPEDEKE